MTRWVCSLSVTFALCLAAAGARAGSLAGAAGSVDLMNAEGAALTHPYQGAYYDVNQDTVLIATRTNSSTIVDDTIFFGVLGDSSRTRSSAAGGAASGGSVLAVSQPSTPEPAELLLATAGALLLAFRRRR